MTPITAYLKGFMTPECPLYPTTAALASMYSEQRELNEAINQAYDKRDPDGFIIPDYDYIGRLQDILKRMAPIMEALEAKLREEVKEWESLP
jgi:hypothetical protein